MNTTDLVTRIAQAAAIPKRQAAKALHALTQSIQDTLREGGRVTLMGFGTFAVRARAARTGRNPRTGQALFIPAQKRPRFTAGKHLREAIK